MVDKSYKYWFYAPNTQYILHIQYVYILVYVQIYKDIFLE